MLGNHLYSKGGGDSSSSSGSVGFCSNTSKYDIVLGCILIVGIQASYIPQHLKIIQNRSSCGINPVTFLLSNFGAYANILVGLLTEVEEMDCCRVVSFGHCNAKLLSIYQLSIGWINNVIMYGLLLSYFVPNPGSPTKQLWERRIAFYGYLFYMVVMIGVFGSVVIWMDFTQSEQVRTRFAEGWSGISIACNLLTWGPQIWQTYVMKSPGSLSVIMLLLQAPGSFAVVILQIGLGASFLTWMPYVATGVQQTILIIECLFFMWKERQRKLNEVPLQSAVSVDESAAHLLKSTLGQQALLDDDEDDRHVY